MGLNRRDLDDGIQDVLDGVASDDQIAWLKDRLACDADAQALYEKRKELFRMLAQVEEVPVPANLTDSVLAALPAGACTPLTPRGWAAAVRGALSPGRMRWAIPFATGVAAGGILIGAFLGSPALRWREALQTAGTMSEPSADEPGAARDLQDLTVGDARVITRIFQSGNSLIAHLEFHSTEEAQVTIEYDPAMITATSLQWSRPDGNQALLAGGQVQFRVRGNPAAHVSFQGAGSGGETPVGISLRTRDGEIHGLLRAQAPNRVQE
jgi:hypothetical protein